MHGQSKEAESEEEGEGPEVNSTFGCEAETCHTNRVNENRLYVDRHGAPEGTWTYKDAKDIFKYKPSCTSFESQGKAAAKGAGKGAAASAGGLVTNKKFGRLAAQDVPSIKDG